MSRVNMPHDHSTVRGLKEVYEELTSDLDDLSKRLKKEMGRKKLPLAHQVTIDQGILATRKLIREANAKLDTMIDEKKLRR